jgi:ADP-ribose pyrophosphatase
MTKPDDPATIDWPARQARALVPFGVADGRPVIPAVALRQRDKIRATYGRNGLPLWGENPEAAALVTATHAGRRWVLLAQRPDDGTWAMPSGPMAQDEKPKLLALHFCRIQAGLWVALSANVQGGPPYVKVRDTSIKGLIDVDAPQWVPDPRGSMEAWVVLVVARFDLGKVDALPEVRGRWFPASGRLLGWDEVDLFPAHREILAGVR